VFKSGGIGKCNPYKKTHSAAEIYVACVIVCVEKHFTVSEKAEKNVININKMTCSYTRKT